MNLHIFMLALALSFPVLADDRLADAVPPFSRCTALTDCDWIPLSFAKRPVATQYRLTTRDAHTALHAESVGGASALIWSHAFAINASTRLRWRWWAEAFPLGTDEITKAGDDYAARLYIGFPADDATPWPKRLTLHLLSLIYEQPVPAYTLSYVWSRDLPLGAEFANPNTDSVWVIVVSQGVSSDWQVVERDIAADFQRAFGHSPNTAQGIAIMSDADDTGSRAVAWYGDIELKPQADLSP